MNIERIQSLINQQESETLEFKKSTSQLKAAFETLCGFLNTNGGTVLIGVSDKGSMVGQEVTDNTRKEIARELNKIEPHADIQIEYVPYGLQKYIILLRALKGMYCPHVYEGRSFQRNQSTTIKMTQHRYEQLLIQRGHLNYAWDEMPAVGYDLSLLNTEEIQRTVKQGIETNRISEEALNENTSDLLKRMRLMRDGTLTNAAVVLFAADVLPTYSQCHIKMARFRGIDKTGEFIDNQSLYGNALFILSEATMFIKRHLPIASIYKKDSFDRIDESALPFLAIREGIINAICHRDYSNRSSYISIAIYDDRLEIWSYGLLPSELTIEDLKKQHASCPRNRLIAEVFYNRGFVEKWGTGTIKMINLCKEREIPLPEFVEYSNGLSVTFKFKTPIKTVIETSYTFPENLTLRQKQIVEILINQGALSPRDIITKLEESVSERTLRNELSLLKTLDILDKRGQANATRWFKK